MNYPARLIVLTGLAVLEKNRLADALSADSSDVTRLRQISSAHHLTMHSDNDSLVLKDMNTELLPGLQQIDTRVAIFLTSEDVNPEEVFSTITMIQDALPDLDVKTVAVIDDRTCDCFPETRSLLEQYADFVVHAPFDVAEVCREILYE